MVRRRGKLHMTIIPAIRELIESGPLAHVTTLNADGSPQVSVVWVGIDGNELITAHMGEWQKVKNLRNDPRVALSLPGRGKNAMGLQEYLVVYGRGRRGRGPSAASSNLPGPRRRLPSRTAPQQARLHRAHHAGTLRGHWSVAASAALTLPECAASAQRLPRGD